MVPTFGNGTKTSCDPMNPDYYDRSQGVGVDQDGTTDIGRIALDLWTPSLTSLPSPSASATEEPSPTASPS